MIAPLDDFASAHIPANARQDVTKAAATIRYLAKVRSDRLPDVDQWLKAHA